MTGWTFSSPSGVEKAKLLWASRRPPSWETNPSWRSSHRRSGAGPRHALPEGHGIALGLDEAGPPVGFAPHQVVEPPFRPEEPGDPAAASLVLEARAGQEIVPSQHRALGPQQQGRGPRPGQVPGLQLRIGAGPHLLLHAGPARPGFEVGLDQHQVQGPLGPARQQIPEPSQRQEGRQQAAGHQGGAPGPVLREPSPREGPASPEGGRSPRRRQERRGTGQPGHGPQGGAPAPGVDVEAVDLPQHDAESGSQRRAHGTRAAVHPPREGRHGQEPGGFPGIEQGSAQERERPGQAPFGRDHAGDPVEDPHEAQEQGGVRPPQGAPPEDAFAQQGGDEEGQQGLMPAPARGGREAEDQGEEPGQHDGPEELQSPAPSCQRDLRSTS